VQTPDDQPDTATATRSLLASGFDVTGATRGPNHIEFRCERRDALGALLRYLIALFDCPAPPASAREQLTEVAFRDGRALVLIAIEGGADWLSWHEFTSALGGAIPTWRALASEYASSLETASRNELPDGVEGEAWEAFERLVADGFEFVLGRRVRRMGGRRRGQAVSDLVAQTASGLLVIDAKASGAPFDVNWAALRPLRDYVRLQRTRQSGQVPVLGAVLVAANFAQEEERLTELSGQFLAEEQLPLSFVPAQVLGNLVRRLTEVPQLRNAIRWPYLFAAGRLVGWDLCSREIRDAEQQRVTRS
jgi:hypothetical protein